MDTDKELLFSIINLNHPGGYFGEMENFLNCLNQLSSNFDEFKNKYIKSIAYIIKYKNNFDHNGVGFMTIRMNIREEAKQMLEQFYGQEHKNLLHKKEQLTNELNVITKELQKWKGWIT